MVFASESVWTLAERFDLPGRVVDLHPFGDGLINDTFMVATDRGRQAVMQRINTDVFPNPEWLQHNLRRLHQHRDSKPAELRSGVCLPEIVQTVDGQDYYQCGDGGFWRMCGYIESSYSLQRLQTATQARGVGAALGRFHSMFADLPADLLRDPLPQFHHTPAYLESFCRVVADRGSAIPSDPLLEAGLEFVEARRPGAAVLEDARRSGTLRTLVIHGDPKVDNVLFSRTGGRVLGLIDLDTVKPGLILHDLGDCLRSCCNLADEDGNGWAGARFDLERCKEVLTGYRAENSSTVTVNDRAFLYSAIWVIPFELGLRFLTDHLAGNRYFKVRSPGDNLRRATVQFGLVESIERQEAELRGICESVFC